MSNRIEYHPATNITTSDVRKHSKVSVFGAGNNRMELSVPIDLLVRGAPNFIVAVKGDAKDKDALLEELTSLARNSILRNIK
jgi:hypothetical protein